MVPKNSQHNLRLLLVNLLLLISILSFSQELTKIDSIKKALLIPKNITQCFDYLNVAIKPSIDKDSVAFNQWHFGIGLWIRNNWIATNSQLWSYFKSFGYFDPDGISSLLESGFKEFLQSKIKDPEVWIKQKKEERDNLWVMIDGKLYRFKNNPIKDPDDIKLMKIYRETNSFHEAFKFPHSFIQIVTKKGVQKSDRLLIQNNPDFKTLRISWTTEQIIFTFKGDTINFADLVGYEKKVFLTIDFNSIPNVKVYKK